MESSASVDQAKFPGKKSLGHGTGSSEKQGRRNRDKAGVKNSGIMASGRKENPDH